MARRRLSDASVLSSARVAAALGVGVSSVKRWTNDGSLLSLRTPGGHRRYRAADVRRFAEAQGFDLSGVPAPAAMTSSHLTRPVKRSVEAMLAALRLGHDAKVRALLDRGETGDLDTILGTALHTIGERWNRGTWTIEQEHRASYLVAEAIDRLRPAATGAPRGRALLAAPPSELHDLPLRMVRLVLERAGWATIYLGADVPWPSLAAAALHERPELVLLTARDGAVFRSDAFAAVVREIQRVGAKVGVGGWWARGGGGQLGALLRFRSLRGFERWLRSGDSRAGHSHPGMS